MPRRVAPSTELETAADAEPQQPAEDAATGRRDDDTGQFAAVPAAESGAAAGSTVAGRVILERAGEAVVTLVDEHGGQHGRALTVDGGYELALPGSGAWLLVVSAPGHAPRADRVVAAGRPSAVRHDVSLVASEPIADDARPAEDDEAREPQVARRG